MELNRLWVLNKSEVEIMKHYNENVNPMKVMHFMSSQKRLLQKNPFLFTLAA